jgi:hypothetical protein
MWAGVPTVAELVKNVSLAAMDLNPRMLVDPREGIRYVATLVARHMQLQSGLILRSVLNTQPTQDAAPHAADNIRSIA